MNETTIPVLPCASLDEVLEFYQCLNFAVTHRQTSPYVYAIVTRGGFELHFLGVKRLNPEKSSATCLVMASEVDIYHREFSDRLRERCGKVPTAGLPRISRLRKGQRRFTVVDPSGNSVIYIRREKPEGQYDSFEKNPMGLAKAVQTAAVLRDMKTDDPAAAKVLDVALRRYKSATPIDRARALAARAELALAMGDADGSKAFRGELEQVLLSDEERRRFRQELEAVDNLEHWLEEPWPRAGEVID